MTPRPFDLTGQVALVTGAGSAEGIGLACARLLGRLGARLLITSTTPRAEGAPLVDLTDEQWRDALDRNLSSAFLVTRAALRPMLEAGYGRIVNVASVSGPLAAGAG